MSPARLLGALGCAMRGGHCQCPACPSFLRLRKTLTWVSLTCVAGVEEVCRVGKCFELISVEGD